MCTITLSYDQNNKVAIEKLAALLSTGLFEQVLSSDSSEIDYADPSLYEVDESLIPQVNKSMTPEELEKLIINDVRSIYKMKDAI